VTEAAHWTGIASVRVLVVEDQRHLREQLERELRRGGYAVDAAADGPGGLALGRTHPYDVAIIDLGLPGLGGVELIQTLRADELAYPILILTARDDWQDKVTGLEAGADDYLTKPFHMEELKARLHALLRRSGGKTSSILRFGPLTVDTGARTVQRDGDPIELTSYEYNTLEYLMHRAGDVVSKSELTEHIYRQDYDRDSNTIEVFVGRLRKKLDPDGDLNPIRTVRGQGYRFEAKLAGS
jgi:two-component system response regulator PhoP